MVSETVRYEGKEKGGGSINKEMIKIAHGGYSQVDSISKLKL